MSFFIIMRNFQLLILLGVFQCILGFDSQQTTIYSSRNLEFNCIPDEVDLRISEVSTNKPLFLLTRLLWHTGPCIVCWVSANENY